MHIKMSYNKETRFDVYNNDGKRSEKSWMNYYAKKGELQKGERIIRCQSL